MDCRGVNQAHELPLLLPSDGANLSVSHDLSVTSEASLTITTEAVQAFPDMICQSHAEDFALSMGDSHSRNTAFSNPTYSSQSAVFLDPLYRGAPPSKM